MRPCPTEGAQTRAQGIGLCITGGDAGSGLCGVWTQGTTLGIVLQVNGSPWSCAVCNLCGCTWLLCPGYWFAEDYFKASTQTLENIKESSKEWKRKLAIYGQSRWHRAGSSIKSQDISKALGASAVFICNTGIVGPAPLAAQGSWEDDVSWG